MSPEAEPATLSDWLRWIEGLHSKTVELGLDRVREVAARMALVPAGTVITVGGTNGKGSTCALLEAILTHAGYRVAVYTSPHLIDFNERARINGAPATDAQLVPHFAAVEQARAGTALTYFEFSTLAILSLFAEAKPDVTILEVGLGGRLDAVNIVDAHCAIVTCVDIDHADWLGDDRESIGWEKAHIFRTGRPAICSDPMPPQSLVDFAKEIDADLWLFGRDFNYAGDRQQWSYGGRAQRRSSLAYPALRGANQLLNAAGVLAALESLRDRLPVTQQAVRQGLASVSLPGRFQVLAGRPAVVLDVAHNPHAAAHLATNLDSMGYFPTTWAVFGAMADKDIDGIVSNLASRIDHWLVVPLPGERAAQPAQLLERLAARGIVPTRDRIVEARESPREALAYAQGRMDGNDRIVVFGSFLTVADILTARRSTGATK